MIDPTWREKIIDEITAPWRKKIIDEMSNRGETWEDVVYCTLNEAELDTRFDSSYGSIQGQPFTLWTKKRVYYPVDYDGSEWCESVPRDPCDEAKDHSGAGG